MYCSTLSESASRCRGPDPSANPIFVWRSKSARRLDEAAAEALRGMNKAPDPPRAPGNQFQHNMGQSESPAPALSGGQGDPQSSTELTPNPRRAPHCVR